MPLVRVAGLLYFKESDVRDWLAAHTYHKPTEAELAAMPIENEED